MGDQGSHSDGIGTAQVTAPERRATAADAVGRLIEAVRSQGPGNQTWYLMLLDIRDILASPAPDDDALREADEMVSALYRGPRNFSEFHIWHEDEQVRIRENQKISDTVRTLRESLRS